MLNGFLDGSPPWNRLNFFRLGKFMNFAALGTGRDLGVLLRHLVQEF